VLGQTGRIQVGGDDGAAALVVAVVEERVVWEPKMTVGAMTPG
jgi:hypothetical protein